ncbi:MAG: hypothetical protein M1357_02205 [Candidatus Marsarchaeota archaeon]|nr:hypothetical protein [Candidatus Marsarchaeota archaeon]
MCGGQELRLVVATEKEGEVWSALILCTGCKRWYPVINGIPHMLPDDMRKREDEQFISANSNAFPQFRLSADPPLYAPASQP